MNRHTVTKAEMGRIIVTEQIASATGRGENKKLVFSYDIGRKRLTFVVSYLNDGRRELAYDTLDEAITAYNEL